MFFPPRNPEVQQPEERRIGQQNLTDQIGPSRFNQTSSFDGFASSQLRNACPCSLRKMGTGVDGASTGGLVWLVRWSGVAPTPTAQSASQAALHPGTVVTSSTKEAWRLVRHNSLSALGNSDYALYWKSVQGENRIKMNCTGTQGTPDAASRRR